MLCQFSFKNFKSYKELTVFDFQAASLQEFKDSLIKNGGDLLPVGVIYGPNGGGKSNLLFALTCLISTVVKPIHELGKNRFPIIAQTKETAVPFLFDEDSKEEASEFQIFFRTEKNEFRYYLAVQEEEIAAETLMRKNIGGKRAALIFDRENDDVTLGATLRKKVINTQVNPKMPFLSFLAINYDLPVITEVQEFFETCITQSYANPVAEQRIMVADDPKTKERILQALNDMDIDITGYRFDKENQELYLERFLNNKTYELPFELESDGTRKLIAVLPVVLMALQHGSLMIVDELDAKLHPKLLRYVISLFKNPKINTKGAQLLFTSHDMSTMKNTVFRRDEIWFAAVNEKHESEIYSLYEIRNEDNQRVKSTASYDKQYLEGRYGADPYLQNMLTGGVF